ncbi:MAG: hypothetical protein PWR30_576 [Candidatus Woesearchaeota archaeon]|nr:hypothetical protein [Candidatus Woesearchaeota archaeon]
MKRMKIKGIRKFGKKGAVDLLSNSVTIVAVMAVFPAIFSTLFSLPGCSLTPRAYLTGDSYTAILEINTEQILMREDYFHISIPSEGNKENEEIEMKLSIADAIALWAQYDLIINDYDSEDRKIKNEIKDAKDYLGDEILERVAEELNKISSIQWIYASIYDFEDGDFRKIESQLKEISTKGNIKVITKEIPLFSGDGIAYFGVAYFDCPPEEEYNYE